MPSIVLNATCRVPRLHQSSALPSLDEVCSAGRFASAEERYVEATRRPDRRYPVSRLPSHRFSRADRSVEEAVGLAPDAAPHRVRALARASPARPLFARCCTSGKAPPCRTRARAAVPDTQPPAYEKGAVANMRSPRDGAARSPGANSQAAGETHTNDGRARQTAKPHTIVARTLRVVDSAAVLAARVFSC
jgi:hypothetical protein